MFFLQKCIPEPVHSCRKSYHDIFRFCSPQTNKKIFENLCYKISECVLRELSGVGKIGKMRQTSRTAQSLPPNLVHIHQVTRCHAEHVLPQQLSAASIQPQSLEAGGQARGSSSSSSCCSPAAVLSSSHKLSLPSDASNLQRRHFGGRNDH